MKGFDYMSHKAVDRSIAAWREVARTAVRRGGSVREDRQLGETWIKGPQGLIAEVYGVNLRLGDDNGRPE